MLIYKNRSFAIRCLDMLADGLIQANQSIVEFIIKGAFIYDDVKSYVKIFKTVDVKLEYYQCRKTQFTVDIGELGWRDWDSTCFNIKLYIVKRSVSIMSTRILLSIFKDI